MWIPGQSSDRHFSRGGWRGRGRGGFPSRGSRFPSSSDRNNWTKTFKPSPEPPLGLLLSSLTKSDFDQDAKDYESTSVITDCKAVASYNWLDRKEPTIAIPGKPPRWTPLAGSNQLKGDHGEYFRDRNSANFPKHPIEPAIVASLTMSPDLARRVDIVACGSTLGNLLRFLRGEDKTFRMLVELVGETVFFIRRENTPRELIPDVKGYGHSFPEAYTTWDPEVRGSTSHQRVISYQFGGLKCLVRYEGDGYIAGEDDADERPGRPSPAGSGVAGTVDDLSDVLAGSRVTSVAPTEQSSALRVIKAGRLVGQDRIFELKTRSIVRKEADRFEDTFGDQLPRLWVAQVPRFILAYHTRGVFQDKEITVRDTKEDIKAWERDRADVLTRLPALIRRIATLVRARPDNKLELRHDAVGILEVREQLADAGDALSERVRALWVKGEETTNANLVSRETGSDSDNSDHSAGMGWDDDECEPDFTACSADSCGYCGRCSY